MTLDMGRTMSEIINELACAKWFTALRKLALSVPSQADADGQRLMQSQPGFLTAFFRMEARACKYESNHPQPAIAAVAE
jgi:hypothetical protein